MNFAKWHRWIRLAFWLALAVTLVMALLPNPPALPVQANDKVQHMAAFAALTFLAALGFPSLRLRVIFVWMAALGLASSGSSVLTYSLNASSLELSQSASRITLDAVTGAIQSLAQTRGSLGAIESRLHLAVSNLSVARENFAAAESRIRDLDIAEEAANLTRLNILQNAGVAVLAQANQAPALALKLLS